MCAAARAFGPYKKTAETFQGRLCDRVKAEIDPIYVYTYAHTYAYTHDSDVDADTDTDTDNDARALVAAPTDQLT